MSVGILEELERLIQKSAKKRTSFLLAVTKSSRSISKGADEWFDSEVELVESQMNILKEVMPKEVSNWKHELGLISSRFKRAISFLNDLISKAERGEISSISQIPVPEPKPTFPSLQKEEEDKKLNLVSSILEVFDSASDLEKLINEVERESMRTVSTAKLVMKALGKTS